MIVKNIKYFFENYYEKQITLLIKYKFIRNEFERPLMSFKKIKR